MSLVSSARTDRKRRREILEAYRQAQIVHPAQNELLNELLEWIDAETTALMLLVGATGVGKTRLREALVERIQRECTDTSADHFCVINVRVELAPGSRQPPLLGVVLDALDQTGESLIDRKRPTRALADIVAPFDWGKTNMALVRRLVKKCQRGRPHLVIIDDAHDLLPESSIQYQTHVEPLKWMVEKLGCVLLVGTHDLLNIRQRSTQLSRRCYGTVVELRRYGLGDQDWSNFLGFVLALQNYLLDHKLIDPKFKMLDDPRFLYRGCVGCVGMLKDWVEAALRRALQHGKLLGRNDLERTAKSPKDLENLLKKAADGEGRARTLDEDWNRLDLLLGFEPAGPAAESEQKGASRKTKRKGSPVQRRLGRDPVGTEHFDRAPAT